MLLTWDDRGLYVFIWARVEEHLQGEGYRLAGGAGSHWALPTPGGPDDFPRLVEWLALRDDLSRASASRAARALWRIRWTAGQLLGWDGPDAGLGSRVPTLRDRFPADLRGAPSGPHFRALPFTPLYMLHDEWAAEIANRTVHGVLHIGWVPDGTGGYRGQMAVLLKPNGRLGTG